METLALQKWEVVALDQNTLKATNGGFFGAFLAGFVAGYLIITAWVKLSELVFK